MVLLNLSLLANDLWTSYAVVNFTQKHEVQQIYVRSTARVYEIYYAPNFQSDNEYLCTVRCGIAARDEQVLHTTDNEEVLSARSKGYENNLSGEGSRTDSNLSTSEDDWVEVKVPNASVLSKKEHSSPVTQERCTQVFASSPCVFIFCSLFNCFYRFALCSGMYHCLVVFTWASFSNRKKKKLFEKL